MLRILTLLSVGLLSSAFFTLASAQTPGGSLTVTANPATVQPGGSTQIACEARNAAGSALGADIELRFSIVSQAGTGATLEREVVTTGTGGGNRTFLTVGSTPGSVVVACTSAGLTQGQVTVQVVGAGTTPAPTATRAPSTATASAGAAGATPTPGVTAPRTGDGGLLENDSSPSVWPIALISAILVSAIGFRLVQTRK